MKTVEMTGVVLSLGLLFGGCSSHVRTARNRATQEISLTHSVRTVSFLDDKALFAGGFTEMSDGKSYREHLTILERQGTRLVPVCTYNSKKTQGSPALFMKDKVERLDEERFVFTSESNWGNPRSTAGYRVYVAPIGKNGTTTALTEPVDHNGVFVVVPGSPDLNVYFYDQQGRDAKMAKLVSKNKGAPREISVAVPVIDFLNQQLSKSGPNTIKIGQIKNHKLWIKLPMNQPNWKPDAELFTPSPGFLANTATTATTVETPGHAMVVGVDRNNLSTLHATTAPLP